MNILFIASRFPYPPLKGDQTRGYHQLRLLSKVHKITLLTFAPQHQVGGENQIHDFCQRIITIPSDHISKIIGVARTVSYHYPFQTAAYYSYKAKEAINQLIQDNKFDVAHVQLARMAPYLEFECRLPRVIDLIDALSLNMERRYQQDRGVMKLMARIEMNRMRKYERQICRNYDAVTVVSEFDRKAIGEYDNLYVNVHGVDLEKFRFVTENTKNPSSIIFSGNMSYFPNINAVEWFVKEVYPIIHAQIPAIRFQIVGVNPHERVKRLAKLNPSIEVLGYVNDIAAYIGSAEVAVAPLQAGSGVQSKILEALAVGTPVVATPYAVKGLQASDNEHLLIGVDPENFAEKILQLLRNDELRKRLANIGRTWVEKNFTWQPIVAELQTIYDSVIHQRSRNM